jgi:broad specificity phosphatase PhoE
MIRRSSLDRAHDTPLSTAGVVRASAMAEGKNVADVIVASPLIRCVQTAIPQAKDKPIILDARFMEVYHSQVIGALASFTLRTYAELPPDVNYIRTPHGLPTREERHGTGGDADNRYVLAIQEYAERAYREGVKNVQIFTHGDCVASFAKILGKEIYSADFGCSITGVYNGEWKFISSKDVGIMEV